METAITKKQWLTNLALTAGLLALLATQIATAWAISGWLLT